MLWIHVGRFWCHELQLPLTRYCSLAGIRASSKLFSDGLWGVLRAPMSFIEVTPMGRIVARLSADLAKIDVSILSHTVSV